VRDRAGAVLRAPHAAATVYATRYAASYSPADSPGHAAGDAAPNLTAHPAAYAGTRRQSAAERFTGDVAQYGYPTMTPPLCEEMLEFSERATSHDTPTESGTVTFARPCDLVADVRCNTCGYAVCSHHRWARHSVHDLDEFEARAS
jgi:hypothetical protein